MKALPKRHRFQSEEDEKDGSTSADHRKSPAGVLVAVIWLLAEMGDNGREVYVGSVQ
jgi:hypothetical protein